MTDQPSTEQTPKRHVRNPETFRERAIKASVENEKPQRNAPLHRLFNKIVPSIATPLGRSIQKVFSVQPFKSILWLGRIVGKVLVPKYFRSSWQELRLVSWPNWRLSRRLTYAVLGFAIVFGTVIALVDYGLSKVFKQILLK